MLDRSAGQSRGRACGSLAHPRGACQTRGLPLGAAVVPRATAGRPQAAGLPNGFEHRWRPVSALRRLTVRSPSALSCRDAEAVDTDLTDRVGGRAPHRRGCSSWSDFVGPGSTRDVIDDELTHLQKFYDVGFDVLRPARLADALHRFPRARLRHGAHPSSADTHRRRSDVTDPCSRPRGQRQLGGAGPSEHPSPHRRRQTSGCCATPAREQDLVRPLRGVRRSSTPGRLARTPALSGRRARHRDHPRRG